ncbi:MAG: LuxR C-terminal-related transcriptional regulator, partial [Bacteroidota bacterium]
MIYTFYSYKGGVGRSHALANLAAYLCYFQQRRVLMIDWDLEAPGLHFYFGKSSAEIESKGLIDVMNEQITVVRNADPDTTISEDDFFNPFGPTHEEGNNNKTPISSPFIQNLREASEGGRIDLMPATRYDDTFRARIEDFDWIKFYDELYGGSYLMWLRQELSSRYDYVFIDSRTGFNDYSGICNVLMPDMNLIFVAPNAQNFEGSKAMADRIINSPFTQKGRRKPYILPILSRLDNSDERAEEWLSRFATTFHFVVPLLEEGLNNYTVEILEHISARTVLYYNRSYALGERIIFNNEGERITAGSPRENFQNIALDILEQVKKGGAIITARTKGEAVIEKLNDRNKRILSLGIQGLNDKEIAKKLKITSKTVEKEFANLILKLNVRNR